LTDVDDCDIGQSTDRHVRKFLWVRSQTAVKRCTEYLGTNYKFNKAELGTFAGFRWAFETPPPDQLPLGCRKGGASTAHLCAPNLFILENLTNISQNGLNVRNGSPWSSQRQCKPVPNSLARRQSRLRSRQSDQRWTRDDTRYWAIMRASIHHLRSNTSSEHMELVQNALSAVQISQNEVTSSFVEF